MSCPLSRNRERTPSCLRKLRVRVCGFCSSDMREIERNRHSQGKCRTTKATPARLPISVRLEPRRRIGDEPGAEAARLHVARLAHGAVRLAHLGLVAQAQGLFA